MPVNISFTESGFEDLCVEPSADDFPVSQRGLPDRTISANDSEASIISVESGIEPKLVQAR